MDGASFDPTRWDHWLLLSCFIGVSAWGLRLSWQWHRAVGLKRQQVKVARRLAMELHSHYRSSPTAQRPIYENALPERSASAQMKSSPVLHPHFRDRSTE